MSVKLDQTSELQALKADGSALAPSFSSGVDGYSVSVWVYFETLPQTTGIHVVWWYGKKEEDSMGVPSTQWVRLEYQFSTGRFRVSNGSGYSSNVAVSQGGDDLVAGVWYLVTFTAKHDTTNDPSDILTHTLHVNGRTDTATLSTSTPPTVANFNRFTLGRIGAEETEDTKAVSCLVEQAAIWNRVLTQDEHDTMFEDDDADFDGVPRSPSVIGVEAGSTEKGLGYWILGGHFRHGIKVDPNQTTSGGSANEHIAENAGDLFNESKTPAGATLPFMLVDVGSPRWSANSPNVFFPEATYSGTLAEHAPRRIPVSRMSPACFFFSKPEIYPPASNPFDEGEHPIYDDPFFRVFSRISGLNCNDTNRTPPYFSSADYLPATYITNIARRMADWFEYQGMFEGKGAFADGLHEGCVFITGVAQQSGGGAQFGNWGRSVGDTLPNGTGATNKGQGIPLHQHPLDEFADDENVTAHAWDNLFNVNGRTLVQQWSDSFYPALKLELGRRGLCLPARMHMDIEAQPELADLVRTGGGWWNHHKYTDPSTVTTMADDTATNGQWSGQTLMTDTSSMDWTLGGMWTNGGLDDTEGDGWPFFDQPQTHEDNELWMKWLLSWMGDLDVYAVWQSVAEPAVTVFGPELKWSNYYRVVADNESYPFTMHTWWRTYTSRLPDNQADFSAPNMYPPPADNIDQFIEDEDVPDHLVSVSRRDVYHRVCRARIDACVNAHNPKPMVPWMPGVGWSRRKNNEDVYILNEPDIRLMMWYAWQRGANEFCFWINSTEDPIVDTDPDGEPGHLEGYDGETDDKGAIADYTATYRLARGVINAIRTCPVYSRDRSMRNCKAWR